MSEHVDDRRKPLSELLNELEHRMLGATTVEDGVHSEIQDAMQRIRDWFRPGCGGGAECKAIAGFTMVCDGKTGDIEFEKHIAHYQLRMFEIVMEAAAEMRSMSAVGKVLARYDLLDPRLRAKLSAGPCSPPASSSTPSQSGGE